MRHFFKIAFLLLLPVLGFSQGGTWPIKYNDSDPSGTPSAAGTRLHFNTATNTLWFWEPAPSSQWRKQPKAFDQISGCAAPAYTPSARQSTFAVNACTPIPELYQWTGAAWVQLNEGAVYTAGTGIAISGGNVISNTGDLSNTNELNVALYVNAGSLIVEDAGGTVSTPLSQLRTIYSAGTGISINMGTGEISNTAPDQTVTLADGTGIDVTGTYPNFTVTNTSPNVVQTLSIAGQDLSLSSGGGTVTIPGREKSSLGVILNQTVFTGITGFTANGTTPTASSNRLDFSGGANTFTQSLDYSRYTALEYWKSSIVIIATDKTATSYGFGTGIRGANSFGLTNVVGRFDQSTGANSGKVLINAGVSNTLVATSSTALTWSAGDAILLVMERRADTLTVRAKNVTTNSGFISANYGYIFMQSNPFAQNTGRFAIFNFGGAFSLDSMAIVSDEIKDADVMVISDSKGQGYNNATTRTRFPELLRQNFEQVVISGGQADRISDVLNRTSEIIELNPRQVVLCVGSNDVRSGVSSATYLANYDTLVSRLLASGIDVFHTTLFYETGVSQSTLIAHIRSAYSSTKIIETYENVAGFLDVDNVHPTKFGHQVIYEKIKDSHKLNGAQQPTESNLNQRFINNQSAAAQSAAFWINGTARVDNSATIGTAVEGAVPLNLRTAPTGGFDFYAFSATNWLMSTIPNRTDGYPLNIGAKTISLGTVTAPGGALTKRLEINAAGEVGLGLTPTGNAHFDVLVNNSNPAYPIYRARNTNTAGFSAVNMLSDNVANGFYFGYINSSATFLGGDRGFINVYSAKPLTFATNSIERMTIGSTGHVGVVNDLAVGASAAPVASARLEVLSTTKGFLPPRMTTAQRDAIASPATGLTLYNTDATATDSSTGVMQVYNGTTWKNAW